MMGQTTTSLTAEAAVVGLLLISAALYRAHPQKWLLRWNLGWLAYLIHLPLSYMAYQQPYASIPGVIPSFFFLASQAGTTMAMLGLAWKPHLDRGPPICQCDSESIRVRSRQV